MNPNAANKIIPEVLAGVFKVFDAMLSLQFSFSHEPPETSNAENLNALLTPSPVVFLSPAIENAGALALLFSLEDALKLSAIIGGESEAPKDALSAEDQQLLMELSATALGGGLTQCMEAFGRSYEFQEGFQVLDTGVAAAESIITVMGPEPGATAISFEAENFSGRGVLLFAPELEGLAPVAADTGATLSTEEMSDILSEFGETAQDQIPSSDMSIRNLEMIKDIRMEATARLGRVEMPIGEILSLGPGSVLEVGHLVDEPIELLINNKLVARGDVIVIDEKFGLRITEIIDYKERIESLR